MLRYRHIYHAGNFADVVKHVVLVALLKAITRNSPACYFHDSHAGAGVYDLESSDARHSQESDAGIGRLWQQPDPPALIQDYLGVVRKHNPGMMRPRFYPGSPAIAQSLLRQHDRLLLTDSHVNAHERLKQQFYKDRRITAHQQDAYQGLAVFLPPAETHGLVLVDPPYECNEEYEQVVTGVNSAYARWPQGIYAIWYPIMSRGLQDDFLDACVTSGMSRQLHVAFRIAAFASQARFVGCGLVLINPPRQLELTIANGLQWLCGPLQQSDEPIVSVDWLMSE